MFCFCYGLEESEESELIQWMFSDPSLRKTLFKKCIYPMDFLTLQKHVRYTSQCPLTGMS